jgi:hypothetical protein
LNSDHQPHILKNFIVGELKRYVRFCSQEKHFVSMRHQFFERLRTRGYDRVLLLNTSPLVKYSQRQFLLFGQVEKEEANDCYDPDSILADGTGAMLLPKNKDLEKSYDLVFKLKGCFQFLKPQLHSILTHEWSNSLSGTTSQCHFDFFSNFFPSIICIQDSNLGQKSICTNIC